MAEFNMDKLAKSVAERAIKELRNNGVFSARWIPVSERLPEPYGQVLRTVKSIGWNGTFSIYVDIGTVCQIDTNVIAWMPLPVPMIPESYMEESED